jgi:DNA-binding NarL/FixJ family response regulator
VIVIRTFKDGVLSDISIWKIAGALNNAIEKEAVQRVQINLIVNNGIKKKRQVIRESNQQSFYFVATAENDVQQVIKDILLEKEIVGLTKSLTEREIDVLKELHLVKNTKEAASNLHISSRTFANHRFNITKKLAIPATEAADFLFDCSNAELFAAMIED